MKSKYAQKAEARKYQATAQSKTAKFANPRHKGETKREKRLRGRVEDFRKGSQAQSKDKQGDRWDTGGYHCPGSL